MRCIKTERGRQRERVTQYLTYGSSETLAAMTNLLWDLQTASTAASSSLYVFPSAGKLEKLRANWNLKSCVVLKF